jgi:hypothetical protein
MSDDAWARQIPGSKMATVLNLQKARPGPRSDAIDFDYSSKVLRLDRIEGGDKDAYML